MPQNYFQMIRIRSLEIVALLSVALLCGCSQGARSLKLDKDLAKKSLEQALTAWRDGKTPKDLQSGTPPIICTDFQWANGKKLTKFKISDTESSDGTNLHLSAELAVAGDAGEEINTVDYIVGTSPVITISRP